MWAWGDNSYGQVGDGTNTTAHTPVQVSSLTDITAITTGAYHSIALKKDGTVYVWGRNNYGQLGDGTTTDRSTPYKLSLSGIETIEAGNYHTFAKNTQGSVHAWGDNKYGQLGDGTTTDHKVPTLIRDLARFTMISAGGGATAGIDSNGNVYSWGYSSYGILEDPEGITFNTTLVQVDGISNAKDISVGENHIIVLKKDGTLCAFGDNGSNQFGMGGLTYSAFPQLVDSINAYKTITAVTSPAPITVEYGTAVENLGLPAQVTVTLDNDETKSLNVIWDTSAYKSEQPGEIILPGEIQINDAILNPHNIQTAVKVNVSEQVVPSSHNISSVSLLKSITAQYGTPVEQLSLPEAVMVLLDNGNTKWLDIQWDTVGYNPTQSGKIKLFGELQLTEDVTNTNTLRAEIEVEINAPPQIAIISIDSEQITADQGLMLGVGTKEHALGAATTVDVPPTVTATLEDGSKIELDVTWNDENYKPYQTAEQTIYGAVKLIPGVWNPKNVLAQLDITVIPTQYEVLTISPESISIDVLGGTSKEKIFEMLTPKTIDIEAMNSETAEIVYISSDYTFSDDYLENGNYNPNQLGTQTLIGRFNSAITDTFMPPYVEINVNVIASNIASVPSVEMDAYQSLEFADNVNIPKQVTVETENGMTALVDVEWNTGNYQKDLADDQIITGKLVNLPSGVLQADPEKTATLIVHVQPVDFKVTGVLSDILDAEMDAGYSLAEVQQKLPVQTVKVQLESTNLEEPISIEYDMPFSLEEENNSNYDSTVATLYVLTGTFNLPANISNPDNYAYEIFLMTLPVEIQSIEPAYVTTTMGTAFADIEKPAQVCVTLKNGKQQWIDVDWGTGEGYVSDSDELTEDNPVQSTVTGELRNRPDYINFAEEQASLVITVILPRVYYINSISPARMPETGTMKVNLGSSLEKYTILLKHILLP